MRRFILITLLLLTACGQLSPLRAGTPEPSPTPNTTFVVKAHPDGPLYVGDKVSFEVLAPSGLDVTKTKVHLDFDQKRLGTESFESFGIGGRSQATFYWVWDTAGLEAGPYTLTFTVFPGAKSWTENYSLLPAAALPFPEPDARWETFSSDCCEIYYITGTDAARDIESLAEMADTQAESVEAKFRITLDEKIPLTFMPRVLGHGGFATRGIYVSYLDQNYLGNSAAEQIVHHEIVHWVDSQLGGDFRPSILVEGLAVYLSDGHFKKEQLFPRAAALFDLDWYIPLRELSDSFYTSQHEIGYLEAGALIGYLVETYGWEEFDAFYREISEVSNASPSTALDRALQEKFDLSLDELDKNFADFLRSQTVEAQERTDLYLTVAFYDTVRRYQQKLDPSAYFLTAWLPDMIAMRQNDVVADLLRRPQEIDNLRVEKLLIAADTNLRTGEYELAEANLRAANVLLDMTK